MMEIQLLALVEEDGFRAIRKSSSRGGQYNGPCPFEGCGGTDRFRVQPNQGTYGWFACNYCGRKGTAIDYLMLKRGLSKQEALAMVGWQPKDGNIPTSLIPRATFDARRQWGEPPTHWQDAASDFYHLCQRVLWSEQGQAALAYLRQRGLTDQTIRAAYLGYHPHETYGAAHAWGQTVKLAQGIVIPWLFECNVWRITIRDEHVAIGTGRYTQVAGGSNGLYLADSLTLRRPVVVMTEGELDALSIAQECGKGVAVVATGTTQGSHTPRWVSMLAQHQGSVLIAFDAEEQGDTAARWWLQRLEHAYRFRPWWKDLNQMLQDEADLQGWLAMGLDEIARRQPQPPSTQPEPEQAAPAPDPDPDPCETEKPIEVNQSLLVEQQLERFACVVSRVAAIFPGPCTLTQHPAGMTLEQWVEQQPKRYTPCIFPPLPRAKCPFRVMTEHQTTVVYTRQHIRTQKHLPCKGQPLANGWCEEHQLSQEMLEVGAQIGYPRLHLNAYRTVNDGLATWEQYVQYAPTRWLQQDLVLARSLLKRKRE